MTISIANVFVPMGGSNWLSDISERFSTTTSGLATYLFETQTTTLVIVSATIEKVGGGSDLLELGISENGGVPVLKTRFGTENNRPTAVVSIGSFTSSINDTYQVFVRNVDTTANIIVSNCNFNIINGF